MLPKITSLQNPLVKHLVKLRQNRDYRYDHQSLLIDGIKSIVDISRQAPPKILLTLDDTLIPPSLCANEIYCVTEAVMKKISGTVSPEGLVAEVPMPPPADLTSVRSLIALDQISDPGNLGTLLRTALALGWEGAFILEESCDPFNEKALRASRGATFRLPLGRGSWDVLKKIVQKNHLKPFVADLIGTPVWETARAGNILLVLSNEAHGVSETAKNFCEPITIPMAGDMESLNVAVAGGILMYLLHP
jgi:TrmH family RNA methyltransferase